MDRDLKKMGVNSHGRNLCLFSGEICVNIFEKNVKFPTFVLNFDPKKPPNILLRVGRLIDVHGVFYVKDIPK